MTKREKVLAWIKKELANKKRRKPRPPKGEEALNMSEWHNVFSRPSKARLTGLSKSEKEFALEAVRACGFTPKWTK